MGEGVREEIREGQYRFAAGKGTIDAIFILRQLQEKYWENDKELYFMFVDLEKVFGRVPRVLIEKKRSGGVLYEGCDEDISESAVSGESGR